MPDYQEDYTKVNFVFPSLVDGVMTALAGSPAVSVYKGNGATQSTAGITLTVGFGGNTGSNQVLIDLSSDAFYVVGEDYTAYMSAGTLGGNSVVGRPVYLFSIENRRTEDVVDVLPVALVGGLINSNVGAISGDVTAADNLELQYDTTGLEGDNFPSKQSQLAGLSNVGSATNRPAASYVLTTGTQSANGVSDTAALNGTRHEHTDVAGALELYYQFEIGAGVASSVQMTGYLTSNNDDLEVYAFDWVTSAFVQIGTLEGLNSASNRVFTFDLFVDMTGTGSNFGLVRVRFFDGAFSLTSATLAVDQIFVAFNQQAGGYEGGAVWIDTTLSNTNTVPNVDGISTNPVSTIGAANTLATALNLRKFHVAPNSSITFAAAQENQEFTGLNWSLALGGQSISNSHITGADVSGTMTAATEAHFDHCEMGDCTLGSCHIDESDLEGDFTFSAAANYFILGCYHTSTTSPIMDFGAAVGNTIAHIHNYHGAMTIKNMGQSGTDTLHFSSPDGKLTLDSTNIGGTKNLNGTFELADSSTGQTTNKAGLIIDLVPTALVSGRMDSDIGAKTGNVALSAQEKLDVNTEADTALTDYDAPTKTEMDTAHALLATPADILTTALTESYAANGVAPTLTQLMYAVHQMIMQFGISGTSYTVRKLDDSTTAFVVTLDDGINPTDAKRV